MTPETIRRVTKFVALRLAASGRAGVDVVLFGGEPLLRTDVCAQILLALGPLLTHASIITNGVLLTSNRVRLLDSLGVSEAQITLDGDEQDHDVLRAKRNGSHTFAEILKQLARAQHEVDWHWRIRLNANGSNIAQLPHLIERLAQAIDPSKTTVDVAPVQDVNVGFRDCLLDDQAVGMRLAYILGLASARGFRISSPSVGTCAYCEHGTQHRIVIGPDGRLYSCWDDVGFASRVVGDVDDGYQPEVWNTERWHRCGHQARAAYSGIERILTEHRLKLYSP